MYVPSEPQLVSSHVEGIVTTWYVVPHKMSANPTQIMEHVEVHVCGYR